MKILVACEFSGTVRNAFKRNKHDAWSCDLLSADDHSDKHIVGDIREILYKKNDYDIIIAHPPCTYLCNSGVHWLHESKIEWNEDRLDKMFDGINFFNFFLSLPNPKVCVENPIQHKYAREKIRKPDQIIQPYMFGEPETKATCLWLKGLPNLYPTMNVKKLAYSLPINQRQRLYYARNHPDRWKLRSKTFQGIADAMADQWGRSLFN